MKIEVRAVGLKAMPEKRGLTPAQARGSAQAEFGGPPIHAIQEEDPVERA